MAKHRTLHQHSENARPLKKTLGSKNFKVMAAVFGLTAVFMLIEAWGGWYTNSLALIADAGHMLTDTGSLGLALLAIWFSERPANARKTYGYHRVEILAALVNAVVLLLISFFILYEAWQRFQAPHEIKTGPMLGIAVLGLAVNLISIKLLGSHQHENLNIRGAYLEVMSDMLASAGVIASSLLIMFTGWRIVDPVMSAAIGLFILPRTWNLLNEAVHILLEGTPAHIDLGAVDEAIKKVAFVQAVHDLHIWTLASGVDAMSAHITITDSGESSKVLAELKRVLENQFGLCHTTIQLEAERCEEKSCDYQKPDEP